MSLPLFATPQDSPPNSPLLALDLDDVLVASNAAAAKWHSTNYESITLNDFHYYHYWKNPGWGTPHETMRKVREFYASSEFRYAPLVEGAIEGVRALRQLGFRLVIVTARSMNMTELTENLVRTHFPGCFEAIHYTGAFERKEVMQNGVRQVRRKLEKIEVLHTIGASLLVDDSLENAFVCARDAQPVPVLLFGNWQWNKRRSLMRDDPGCQDYLSYKERQELGMSWMDDEISDKEHPAGIERVYSWPGVVDVVRRRFPQGS